MLIRPCNDIAEDPEMAVSHVKSAIESAIGQIKYHPSYISRHETCTRYALIDPVLFALGWNLADVIEVEVEYEINDSGRVDYALLDNDDKPVVIIEAKALSFNGTKMSQERQLEAYAKGMKRGYAVLTNGADWKVWDLSKRGGFNAKLVLELNLLENTPRQCATALNRLLRRPLHHRRLGNRP